MKLMHIFIFYKTKILTEIVSLIAALRVRTMLWQNCGRAKCDGWNTQLERIERYKCCTLGNCQHSYFWTQPNNNQTCLDVVKEAKFRERQSPVPAVLDFNSPLVVSIVSSARETMLNVSELVHPSTWLPSWNTWPLRFLNWQAMLPVTTRRPVSSPVTCNWPSVMTKNWTNSWLESPLPKEVSSPTSKLFFCPKRPKRPPSKLFYFTLNQTRTAFFKATIFLI